MPGFHTHYFFGEQVKRDLPSSVLADCSVEKHPHAFALGLQGPDLFFHCIPAYLFYPKNIGNVMHDRGAFAFFDALFTARTRLVSPRDKAIADAYISGFMGHYTLDTICHPYVYYRTRHLAHPDRGLYDFGIHVFLETDMDAEVTRKFRGGKPTNFLAWKTVDVSSREAVVISCLLHYAIRKVYPENAVRLATVRDAIFAIKRDLYLLSDPSGRKKYAVRFLEEKKFHHAVVSSMVMNDDFQRYEDPCNLRHLEWKNPWNREDMSRMDVYQMLSLGASRMETRMKLYADAMNATSRREKQAYYANVNRLLSELGDLSYKSGLPTA